MAGYSGTPLARKLGIKEGHVFALIDAPEGFSVPDLPQGVETVTALERDHDVILCFARSVRRARPRRSEERSRRLAIARRPC